MLFRFRPTSLPAAAACLAGGLLALLLLVPARAEATVLPRALFESLGVRYVLNETAQGIRLTETVFGRSFATPEEWVVRLAEPEWVVQSPEIRKRIELLKRDYDDLVLRSAELGNETRGMLHGVPAAEGERMLLQMRAEQLLEFAEFQAGKIRFTRPLESAAPGPRQQATQRFLTDAEIAPTDITERPVEPIEKASPKVRATLEKQVKSFFTKMDECVASRSREADMMANLRYFGENLVIGEALTVAGSLKAGKGNVDWRDLRRDMMVELASQVGSAALLSKKGPFLVSWIKIAGFRVGRAVFDGTYYYFDTDKVPTERPVMDVTINRTEVGVAWGAGTSIIPVTLFKLIKGISCLYPHPAVRAGGFVLRTGISLGTSIEFFELRKRYVRTTNE